MFIVKYAEIGIKSRPVRRRMEGLLISNIKRAYEREGITAKLRKEDGRIVVHSNEGEILQRIFGISSYCKAVACKRNTEEIADGILGVFEKNKTYKIEVKRADKRFPSTSQEMTKKIVEKLEEKGARLGVRSYDEKIVVEIRENAAYVLYDEKRGPGGMPYGSAGKALALFSGGIDSPVAAWMAAKRGVKVDFLFYSFNEGMKRNVLKVFRKLNQEWFLNGKLFVVDGAQINRQIVECRERYRQVIFKRILYRIANSIKGDDGYDGMITGENIGQVSSQTLKNLGVIDKASKKIVLRPLLCFDKNEIVNMAKRIGTYELSAGMPEFCAFTKKKPATAAKLSDVEEEEKKINWKIVEKAVEDMEVVS